MFPLPPRLVIVVSVSRRLSVSSLSICHQLDNRGSDRRGLAFECALRGRLGDVEVADQSAGARWAVAQGLADPLRIAASGWFAPLGPETFGLFLSVGGPYFSILRVFYNVT